MEAINYASAATEALAILICLVLLYGSIFENRQKNSRSNMYIVMVITELAALVPDLLSWVFDGKTQYNGIQTTCMNLAVIMSYILIAEYGLYIYYFLQEKRNISHTPFRLFLIFCSAAVAVTLVLIFTGNLYYIQDGSIYYMPLYDLYTAANILSVCFCTILLTYYRKLISLHDLTATYLYLAVPVIAAAMNFIDEDWEFAYPAACVSLFILYVMLQTERNNKLTEEKEISRYYASHDEMTGLGSRRAYNEKIDELVEKDMAAGVIFGDVNGLKYENDHFGHEAGDRLICRLSECLCRYFRRDEIYRISGDEFVVLLPGIAKEVFDKRTKELRDDLKSGDRSLACIGAEYGSCRKLNDLIRMAESGMYEDKLVFYGQHPEYKR